MGNGSKTYIIDYCVILTNSDGSEEYIRGKQIKVKNQVNELGAKIGLEDYLKRKYDNFKRLEISGCKEDILQSFNNLFGSANPFGSDNPFGDLFFGKK